MSDFSYYISNEHNGIEIVPKLLRLSVLNILERHGIDYEDVEVYRLENDYGPWTDTMNANILREMIKRNNRIKIIIKNVPQEQQTLLKLWLKL